MTINIIGAGLAGSEAALQLAKRKVEVNLYEMKPDKLTEAHNSKLFCELVCSNSLKGNSVSSGAGLLKKELEIFDSEILKIANKCKVNAGDSLAVDRNLFSELVTKNIQENKYINVINKEVDELPKGINIVCTGPLTSDKLFNHLKELLGEDNLYFYDAAAPIITKDSINFNKAYYKSRYDKGSADFINCPFTEEEFNNWYEEVITAETVELKDFEKYFEGCMPFEVLAKRGRQTLTFGALKPKGLRLEDGTTPYAVVQLREDNASKSLYNLVGFQTNLKFSEQKRIIRMIPGLEDAEIVRYGVMHRNTFINSVKHLNKHLQFKSNDNIFFAGQITGLEGYNCAIMSGLYTAVNVYNKINNNKLISYPTITMIGGLINYITNTDSDNLQPIGPNYGLLDSLDFKHSKKERKELMAKRSLDYLNGIENE